MKKPSDPIEQKLETIIDLLKHLLALQLAKSGVKQTAIAKHIRVATAKVGHLLEGVKRSGE